MEHLLRKELGFEFLDRLQQRNNLSEAEAMALALDVQRAVRQTRGHGLEEAYQAAWEEIGDTPRKHSLMTPYGLIVGLPERSLL